MNSVGLVGVIRILFIMPFSRSSVKRALLLRQSFFIAPFLMFKVYTQQKFCIAKIIANTVMNVAIVPPTNLDRSKPADLNAFPASV